MAPSQKSSTRVQPIRQELFLSRKERLIKLLQLDAPNVVIVAEAILVSEAWYASAASFLWTRGVVLLDDLFFNLKSDLGIAWYIFRGKSEDQYWEERCGFNDSKEGS